MTRELNRYYRTLKKNLICSKASRNRFVEETKQRVNDFIDGNPSISFFDVTDFLGDPKTLAETFMESIETKEVMRQQQKRRIAKIALAASLVVIITSLCILVYYIGHMRSEINLTVENETVVYEEQLLP